MIKHLIKRITAKDYVHRQYVVLSAVLGLFIIAFAFNRLLFNRSTIVIHITQKDAVITVDGEKTTPKDLGDNRYAVTVLPGKHTISITAEGAINHKELVEARAGRSQEITPALTIAPDAQSNVIGPIAYSSYDPDHEAGAALFYLGNNGHGLMRYLIDDGSKIALSDPVFRNITQLSWAFDHASVIVRNLKNSWFYFDFRKRDFINSEFQLIGDPTNLDIAFDPTSPRVGFVGYRDSVLVFGVANPRLEQPNILTKLDSLRSPRITWSPSGTAVVLLDDTSFNQQNVTIYDLATNHLSKLEQASNIDYVSYSPDGLHLLLVKPDGHALLYNTKTAEITTFATLVQPKTVTWLTNDTVIALITSQEGTQLVTIQIDTLAVTPYGATPAVSGEIVAMYANADKDVLYFISNDILYTFPLIPNEQ